MRKRHRLCTLWIGVWLSGCDRPAPTDEPPAREPPPAHGARAPEPSDPNQRLDLWAQKALDAELQRSPTTATWLGMHGYDDRLDDVRPEAQAAELGRLRALLDKVRALPEAGLDAAHKLDRLLLERRAEAELWELTELRPLERNPIYYIDLVQSGIFELVEDEQLPVTERLRAISARLWKVRPLLDQARRNLRGGSPQGAPELLVRKATELGAEARAFFAETLPRAVPVADPKLMDDFRAADGDATRALDDFDAWLAKDLLPRARGDLALGRERFLERLRLTEALGPEYTPEQLALIGERELRDAKKRYDEAARQLQAGNKALDVGKLIEDDHGKPEDLQREAQSTVEALVEHARRLRLVTLPKPERPRVLDMPPALWGFAQLETAGPLGRPVDAVIYIDPIDRGWPEKRKQEQLRAFNRSAMTVALAHEVIGHYVLSERDRRAPTTLEKLALAGSFVEGWPHYAERMMVDQGFGGGDPKLRLQVERSVLLRAGRLVAAVKLHALAAKLDDVAKLLVDEAGLDDFQARREAERAAIDPMVMADALGRIEIERLRDDWRAEHEDAPLGAFHDALLAHGTVPVMLLRDVLLK